MASQYDTGDPDPGLRTQILRSVRQHPYTGLLVNIAPASAWLGVFFLVPLAVMLVYSFGERGAFGEVLIGLENLGVQQYTTFFVPAGTSVVTAVWITVAWTIERLIPFNFELVAADPTPYYQLTFRSIWYGLTATVISFVLGYPMAYFVARAAPERYQNLLIVLVVLPYWASYLVRVYAIKLLLAKGGIIPTLVTMFPFVSEAPALLYNDFSIQVGLVYIWVPFMVLPAYASIEQIDFELHEAAMDLGADRLDAFLRVTFPLSLPGVIAGSLLVFIPSVGAYVIPELLGGPSTTTIGSFIASQFGAAGNWPLGAAASFILMAIMLVSIAGYLRRAGGDFL
jgi:spermidine/putrescine transport system permease protein